MIYIFLADGFEDIEALIPLDVLRRCGLGVVTVSIEDGAEVTSAHGVTMIADTLFSDNEYEGTDMLLLPGGRPGADNLAAHKQLSDLLKEHNAQGGQIAAICASPAMVLGPLGIIDGKKATCYPGFEAMAPNAAFTGSLVETDGNVITAEGPAAAFPFAYTLAGMLADAATADAVAEGMRFRHLMEKRS